MADGKVRLRSNVVADGGAWDLVPGEVVGRYRPDLLKKPNGPPQIQVDENMYYALCGPCGRPIHEIMRDGCTQCSYGPSPAQLAKAQEQHARAASALEAARVDLARSTAEAAERKQKPQTRSAETPVVPTVTPTAASLPAVEPVREPRPETPAATPAPSKSTGVPRREIGSGPQRSMTSRLVDFIQRLRAAVRRRRRRT